MRHASIFRYISFAGFAAIATLWHINGAFAQTSVRVAVLPFDIRSFNKEMAYLGTEIPEVVKKHLKTEGAVIVETATPRRRPTEMPHGQLRKIGIMSGADYVIWGTLVWVDGKFSLDAKMLESLGRRPPLAFFVEGESIENLPGVVQRLSKDFSTRIFKRERVAGVLVQGNRRIETDAIKNVIKTKPGDVFLAKSLSEDLKAIFAMGYFDDIEILSEDRPQGKLIVFKVTEKATVKRVRFKGNDVFDEKEIREEGLTIKKGSILKVSEIKSNITRIETLYKDKNYHNVKIDYKIIPVDSNQADIEFHIEEGDKIKIVEIAFLGNSAYTDEDLRDEMQTSEKGFFTWLTGSGEMNKEDLSQDVARLTAFYHNTGYMRARVAEPEVDFREDGIHISVKVEEGPRFGIGEVKVDGDLIRPSGELMERVKITKEEWFSREVIRSDVIAIEDVYTDEGYAYVSIMPRVEEDSQGKKANITYHVEKGKQVYFEKIIIAGNTKTRDKVIRRQLHVHEQELYGGRRLKRSIRNLQRLDYFEDDIKVNTIRGETDDKMTLKLEVTEKSTGMFMFGGGYSSVDRAFGMASLSQRNLFGRGQTLQFKAQVGETSSRYTLSFTEPWLFDIPLSAGFDIYNWETEYDEYDKHSKGGGIRLGYSVYDYTRAYISYKYEIADIDDIDEDASQSIWDLEGENTTSSVTATLQYDSRDKIFNPTEGSDHSITVQYAGLGGDIAFTKYLVEAGRYFPLHLFDMVGFLHAKGGYVRENAGGTLPDYERFYLGGMNSMRGFEWRDIHSEDENGDKIGGNKFVQFNVEWLIPLIKEAGVVGVLFYDTGNVFNNSEEIDLGLLRESAGFGFRWYSPMGPIRIECGYILDPKEGESTGGDWEFTMGGVF